MGARPPAADEARQQMRPLHPIKKTLDLIMACVAVFEATPALAERRSGQHVKNRPMVHPSSQGNQGLLQRPRECL